MRLYTCIENDFYTKIKQNHKLVLQHARLLFTGFTVSCDDDSEANKQHGKLCRTELQLTTKELHRRTLCL